MLWGVKLSLSDHLYSISALKCLSEAFWQPVMIKIWLYMINRLFRETVYAKLIERRHNLTLLFPRSTRSIARRHEEDLPSRGQGRKMGPVQREEELEPAAAAVSSVSPYVGRTNDAQHRSIFPTDYINLLRQSGRNYTLLGLF